MQMDAGLDTGPVLLQRQLEIGAEETAGELAERLADLGAQLLLETLQQLARGRLRPRPQTDEGASVARRLRRSDGVIDWQHRSETLFDRLRGLTPWPGVSTVFRGERLKILWGHPVASESPSGCEPGTIVGFANEQIRVSCGEGTVFGIERLQKAGRRAVAAREFVNGERPETGERLG